MPFEYKTVGGPERPARRRGNRTLADRVAASMQALIRAEAEQGWEYLRTDLVPVEDRPGWLSRKRTVHCAVLVFRRPVAAVAQESRASLSAKAARVFGLAGGRKAEGKPARRAEPEPAPRTDPQGPRLAAPPTLAPRPAQPPAVPPPPTPEQLQAEVAQARRTALPVQETQIRPAPAPAPAPQASQIRPAPPSGTLPPGIADYQPPPLPGWTPAPIDPPAPRAAQEPPPPRAAQELPPPQATQITPPPQATGLFTRMQPLPPRPAGPRETGSQG